MSHVFSATVLGKYTANFEHCWHCDFLRISDPTWLEEAYSSAIAATDIGLVARNIDVARKLAAFIYFVLPGNGGGRFLDIAGGYGMLTRLMRDYGFDFYWSDKYCKNLFAQGFEFEGVETPVRAVTAIEVIEHVVDPVGFLEGVLAETRSEALVFTTEVYQGRPPLPDAWGYYSLGTGQHISFFSKKTLRILAKRLDMHYCYVAGLHVMTRKAISPVALRLFSKKAVPLMLKVMSRRLQSKSSEDHAYMLSLISDRFVN